MTIASKHLLSLMCRHLLALSFLSTGHDGHSLVKMYCHYGQKGYLGQVHLTTFFTVFRYGTERPC